jgi:hypothetical protein
VSGAENPGCWEADVEPVRRLVWLDDAGANATWLDPVWATFVAVLFAPVAEITPRLPRKAKTDTPIVTSFIRPRAALLGLPPITLRAIVDSSAQ